MYTKEMSEGQGRKEKERRNIAQSAATEQSQLHVIFLLFPCLYPPQLLLNYS